jgi:hypothetical protein
LNRKPIRHQSISRCSRATSYIFDGKPVTVQDLTFTFHMAHFFRDENNKPGIPRMKRVIDTTLAIKDLRYPAGWKPSARRQYSDHNNYDVTLLFQVGWKSIDAAQQARVRTEIKSMLRWCLTRSVRGDHFRNIDGDPTDASISASDFSTGLACGIRTSGSGRRARSRCRNARPARMTSAEN